MIQFSLRVVWYYYIKALDFQTRFITNTELPSLKCYRSFIQLEETTNIPTSEDLMSCPLSPLSLPPLSGLSFVVSEEKE